MSQEQGTYTTSHHDGNSHTGLLSVNVHRRHIFLVLSRITCKFRASILQSKTFLAVTLELWSKEVFIAHGMSLE